jgi:hypothetical protein
MSLPTKWLGASALAGLTLLGVTAPRADAQSRGTPLVVPSVAAQALNPNFRVTPGVLAVGQTAFNTSVLGHAIRQVPPYALGYNPYTGAGFAAGYPGIGAYGGYGGYGGYGATLAASPYSYGTGAYGGYGASLSTSPYGGSYGASLDSGIGSPYSGYGGYGPYYEDPTAGYLRGVADVTNANGRYLSQVQQARLLQSQADMSKLDLYRRMREDAAAERKNWLNPEAERIKDMQNAYERATHEPPITEVLSGQALNDLYNHAYPLQSKAKTQSPQFRGPNVPIDEDMLKQVNFTGVGSKGSIGILKDRGKLNWPLVLQSSEYDAARKELGTLAADAVEQVRLNNPVGAATLRDMMADVRRMNDALLRNVGEIPPSEYVEAKRYLNGLDSAIKALQDTNVGNQLNQNWAPRVKNVSDLVDFMSQKGLKFAAATAGDEPAYRHLYQQFVSYDAALSSQVPTARQRTSE